MKMEPIVSSETSAIRTQTLGNYPKRNKLHLEHSESLKTRTCHFPFCLDVLSDNFTFDLIMHVCVRLISLYHLIHRGEGGLRQPWRRADNFATFFCRLSRNSGSLNILEPSGPLQPCTALALPFSVTT